MFKRIMGLIVILFVICLIPAMALAQEKVFTNKDGTKAYIQNPGKEVHTFTWKGSVSNGFAHGKGVLEVYKNGKLAYSYNGNMLEGRENGKGIFKWSTGDIYEGDFTNGKRHGKGIYKWPNGNSYAGDWVDNQRSGKGIFKWADGSTYEGDYVNDKRHGWGVVQDSDGSIIYEGEFENGNPKK